MALDRDGRLCDFARLDLGDESQLVEVTQAPVGTLLAGRYRSGQFLNLSNGAAVIAALDIVLGKRVAIKFVPYWMRGAAPCARMRREGSVLARVRHPNIVRGFRVGHDKDLDWYVVMELLSARPLSALFASGRSLTVGTVVRIIRGVLAGLAALHNAGIVHLDLKHENVLLVPERGAQIPKLIDFNFVLLLGENTDPFCESGLIAGTPGYLAPEQALGQPMDHRANVHGAALLLYELLIGDEVHGGDSTHQQVISCAFRYVRPIHEVRADVPPALSELLESALHTNPAARPQTAQAFREALLQFTDPDPPLAG